MTDEQLYFKVMAPGKAETMRIRIPPELKDRAKRIAKDRGMTISRLVRELLYAEMGKQS